jgi:drug/metabolite transporter (DMT)-like permease
MTLLVFFSVLGAAFLHAGWNAVLKTGVSQQTSMFLMSACQMVLSGAILCFFPWPKTDVWIWILASAVIHTIYQLFLSYAYEQGDLSRVYPIARGSAPLMVLIVFSVLLMEHLDASELFGVLILGLGIALMARGVFASGDSRRLLPFALGSALATAAYTIVDGLGARVSGVPVAYVAWLLMFTGAFYIPSIVLLRGITVLRASPKDWALGGIAALASFGSYGVSVWAMTQAPIALVAALRETSILFAVLIGWRVFGDKMDQGKAIAALLIVIGVAVTRL